MRTDRGEAPTPAAAAATELPQGQAAQRGLRCDCLLCQISRAIDAEPFDREELKRLYDLRLEEDCARCMEFSYLMRTVAEYTAGHDAPELVEAMRVLSPKTAGVHHPDYEPPKQERYQIVYAPSFVEDYAKLTDRDVKEARRALREGTGQFHLTPVPDAEARPAAADPACPNPTEGPSSKAVPGGRSTEGGPE